VVCGGEHENTAVLLRRLFSENTNKLNCQRERARQLTPHRHTPDVLTEATGYKSH